MADLTRDNNIRLGAGPHNVRTIILDNSAAQTVYKGAPIIKDISEDTLYGRVYVDATVLVTANDVFLGISQSTRTVVATADTETDNKVEVIQSGLVGFPTSALTDADVGKKASMADSGVVGVDAPAAGFLEIGRIAYVENGFVFVELNAAGGGAPFLLSF